MRICGLGHYMPAFIRHAAEFGYDCIWLDLEHRTMDDRETQALLGFSHQFDVDVMVRATTIEKTRLYRYFEDGATGVMIPHVSTAAMANDIVQAVKYPPIGDRGLDGAGADADYIWGGGPEYIEAANRETFVVVQIESPTAVKNLESIAAVKGVDALFVGLADLGMRIRVSEESVPTLEESIEMVAAAAAKHNLAWGHPAPNKEMAEKMISQGAKLIPHGGEYIGVIDALRNCSKTLDEVFGE